MYKIKKNIFLKNKIKIKSCYDFSLRRCYYLLKKDVVIMTYECQTFVIFTHISISINHKVPG